MQNIRSIHEENQQLKELKNIFVVGGKMEEDLQQQQHEELMHRSMQHAVQQNHEKV